MKKENIILIDNYLNELLPNVGCELFYNKDYELVIAVMLSAQTSDKAVNKVTTTLFKEHPTLESLNELSLEEIEEYLKPLGLYKNKAIHLKNIVSDLINKFNKVVPTNKNELMLLSGVGNKTAGVIRMEAFNIADFPVDTHIIRITNRLGLVNEKDPTKIEMKLKKIFPKERWISLHHQFIHFGRYYCSAKSPKCERCKLKDICKY